MKKLFTLTIIVFLSLNTLKAQEWFTSFEVAKRLALVQDKMLLVMWQNTLDYPYPVKVKGEGGVSYIFDLNSSDEVNSLIWEHFVPVILLETEYDKFYNKAESKRSVWYMDKLKDDSIKIMDVNGNILNVKDPYGGDISLTLIINKYALNTSFLKQELINYSEKENITTSFNLAAKYLDYAIFVQRSIKGETIDLANIYFDEAISYLETEDIDNKDAFYQKIELLKIKEDIILNDPKRARRLLKRIKTTEINEINGALYGFLNYTIFKLLKDEEKAALWKSKLSSVHLKKAELIINSNK